MRCRITVAIGISVCIVLAWVNPRGFSMELATEGGNDDAAVWKVGVAVESITPSQSTWMAGYASRTKPSEGVISELFAKAAVFEDQNGTLFAIVTCDLIAIPRILRDRVTARLSDQQLLPAANVLLNCSHTHCGPVVKDDLELSVMYELDAEQRHRVEQYFVELTDKLVAVVAAAIQNMQPSRLNYSFARCGFAMNRRLPTADGYQNSPYPDGPVDHEVPVLKVESTKGEIRAILFGYACHNTCTSVQQFNGDYAGFAQQEIERRHPGALALFLMGCGGDQNPYPRGQIEWAKAHGFSLADAVEAALLPKPQALRGPLKVQFEQVSLDFQPVSRAELMDRLQSEDVYEHRGAKALLAEAESSGKVRDSYSYPIQVVGFGPDLVLVALAGEVVVDYSQRLKRELGPGRVWVAAYSNDVFAYIPSARVLREGGYEGATAMRFTSLPGPFQATVEERIVETVVALSRR